MVLLNPNFRLSSSLIANKTVLAVTQEQQETRVETNDLPTQLAADGAPGPGHQNHPIFDVGLNLRKLNVYWISRQQVLGLHRSDARNPHAVVEQLEHTGQNLDRRRTAIWPALPHAVANDPFNQLRRCGRNGDDDTSDFVLVDKVRQGIDVT